MGSEGEKMEKFPGQICDTPVSISWVQNVLYEKILGKKPPAETDSLLSDWSAEKIGLGKGFLSHIIKVKLQWKDDGNGKLPSSVVLKIPTMESLKRLTKDMVDLDNKSVEIDEAQKFVNNAHVTECRFYDMMEKEKVPWLMPRCFLAQKGEEKGEIGILIFEDLSGKGVTGNLGDGLNLTQMLQVADNLAKLHAWSLARSGEWESKIPLMPKENLDKFKEMMIGIFEAIKAKNHPIVTPKMLEPLYGLCEDVEKAWWYAFGIHEELGIPPVLCQGDLWMNNIFWNPQPEDNNKAGDTLVALLDWQIAHPGCPAEDFARILGTSVKTEIRQKHLEEIFKHYFAQLQKYLAKDPPFSYDTFMKAWYRCSKFMLLGGVAINLMSEQVLPGNTPEFYEEFYCRTRDLINETSPHIPELQDKSK